MDSSSRVFCSESCEIGFIGLKFRIMVWGLTKERSGGNINDRNQLRR